MDSQKQQPLAHRIGIIANPQFAHGRNFLRGAIRYIETYSPEIQLDVFRGTAPKTAEELSQYDGILSTIEIDEIKDLLTELKINWIGLYPSLSKSLEFAIDDNAIGALAAKTLDECGVASYGYYDSMHSDTETNKHISSLRLNGYQNAIQEFARPQHAPELHTYTSTNAETLAEWIADLPKPTGIFTYNDLGALNVIEACHNQGISIPDELLLIGVDNDQLLCSLNQPKISSINPQMDSRSFNAMQRLVERIETKEIDTTQTTPTPIAVLRETTGHSSCEHPTIQKALRTIQKEGPHNLSPSALAPLVGISLRSLESLFSEQIGCTVQQALLDAELKSVKQWLRNTELTLESIAAQIDWDPSSLQHAFKRRIKQTPGAYRLQFRANSPKFVPNVQPCRYKPLRIGIVSTLISQAHHEILRGLEGYCQKHPHIKLALRIISKYDESTGANLVLGGDDSFVQYDGYIVTAEVTIPKELIESKPMITIDHHRNQKIGRSFDVDNYGAGQLAAQQYLSRGYTQFAYAGIHSKNTRIADDAIDSRSDNRYQGFFDSLIQAGIPAENIQKEAFRFDISLPKWIATLPPKTAIYSFNDALSVEILKACNQIQRPVPQDIAIISTDNDSFLCELSTPAISSIDIGFQRAGYEIADTLAQIIQNPDSASVTNGKIRVRQLIERESSLAIGNTDPDLNVAVRFIQGHYSKDLSIDDIVATTNLSRRSLETRFKQMLKRSILQELQTVRIHNAQDLLTGSNASIDEIARMCGFKHTRYFCKLFKENTFNTPLDYRKAYNHSIQFRCFLQSFE
ncbi:MAG: substrate-binding domain-containing protein [Lentimonas sp.]